MTPEEANTKVDAVLKNQLKNTKKEGPADMDNINSDRAKVLNNLLSNGIPKMDAIGEAMFYADMDALEKKD